MNFNKTLSWKILLPIGVLLLVIGYQGAIGLLGLIMTMMGIIDLVRQYRKKKKIPTENQSQ